MIAGPGAAENNEGETNLKKKLESDVSFGWRQHKMQDLAACLLAAKQDDTELEARAGSLQPKQMS